MHIKKTLTVIHNPDINPLDWLRFIHLPPFPAHVARFGFSETDLQALEVTIMADPARHAVIKGTGGIRKLRFTPPRSAKGKSGGYRVFYGYFPDYGMVTLNAIIAKNEQGDLSQTDRNALRQVMNRLQSLLEQGQIR